MRSDDRASQSRVHVVWTVVRPTPGFAASPDPRPCYGTSLSKSCALRYLSSPDQPATAAGALRQRKSVPSTHIRCGTTASLRASATLARLTPRSFATRSAHAFNVENRVTRLSMTLAASNKAVRTIASPTLLIRPVRSTSPDWHLLAVNPKYGPTSLDLRNLAGSSIVVL